MSFQENLIRARKARGMTQEELAARLSISRQAVSKWETGESLPDLYKLAALADELGVSTDELCGREAALCGEVPATAFAGGCCRERSLCGGDPEDRKAEQISALRRRHTGADLRRADHAVGIPFTPKQQGTEQ